MTAKSYGATSRRPVYSGSRRVPGLYERTRVDGSTVFEAALRLGGKVRRHRLQACTKTDAIVELRDLQTDYARGEPYRSASAALTVAELAHDWLDHLTARVGSRDPRHRYSARTVALYRQRLDKHILPAVGQRPIAEVTVVDVRRLVDRLASKKLAPSSVSSAISILSGLFRYGIKHGMVDHNPVRDLDRDDRPGVARQSEPRYLTAREVEQLLAELSDTFRPVAAICAYAGLRVSEALGLRWRDADLKSRTVTVRGQLGLDGSRVPLKSESSAATLPMLPALARELRAHRSRQAKSNLRLIHTDALVFTTARGKPQSRRNALRAVHAAGDAALLNGNDREPIGLHDLRHSYIGLAFAAGVSLAEVAALARHANARVTAQIYAGLTDQGRDTAAAKLLETGFGA